MNGWCVCVCLCALQLICYLFTFQSSSSSLRTKTARTNQTKPNKKTLVKTSKWCFGSFFVCCLFLGQPGQTRMIWVNDTSQRKRETEKKKRSFRFSFQMILEIYHFWWTNAGPRPNKKKWEKSISPMLKHLKQSNSLLGQTLMDSASTINHYELLFVYFHFLLSSSFIVHKMHWKSIQFYPLPSPPPNLWAVK